VCVTGCVCHCKRLSLDVCVTGYVCVTGCDCLSLDVCVSQPSRRCLASPCHRNVLLVALTPHPPSPLSATAPSTPPGTTSTLGLRLQTARLPAAKHLEPGVPRGGRHCVCQAAASGSSLSSVSDVACFASEGIIFTAPTILSLGACSLTLVFHYSTRPHFLPLIPLHLLRLAVCWSITRKLHHSLLSSGSAGSRRTMSVYSR